MTDGVKAVEREYEKRIYGKLARQLQRGQGIVATNASIPTKFQTIVADHADKKGFLSQSKRFIRDVQTGDIPAPCQYSHHDSFDKLSPSFSKKGSGGLASKSKRGLKYTMSNAPGPGIYSLPRLLGSRSDFNRRSVTGIFAAPVAEHEAKTNGIPAPNKYNIMQTKTGRVNNVTADAAFKSKSKRQLMNIEEQSRLPAPCQYNIHDEVRHESVRVPFSSFRSQSKREIMNKPQAFPGPGHYSPYEEVEPAKRSVYPRRHCLCISTPAIPLPWMPPMPGPGSYEVVDYEGPSKRYMSSSTFVSTTGRWTGAASSSVSDLPGPAHYWPAPINKQQSFIYNTAGRWL